MYDLCPEPYFSNRPPIPFPLDTTQPPLQRKLAGFKPPSQAHVLFFADLSCSLVVFTSYFLRVGEGFCVSPPKFHNAPFFGKCFLVTAHVVSAYSRALTQPRQSLLSS